MQYSFLGKYKKRKSVCQQPNPSCAGSSSISKASNSMASDATLNATKDMTSESESASNEQDPESKAKILFMYK